MNREMIDLERSQAEDRIGRRIVKSSSLSNGKKGKEGWIRWITVEGGKWRSTCSQKPSSLARREREERERKREKRRETGRERVEKDRARRREVQKRVHQACSSVRVAPLNQ